VSRDNRWKDPTASIPSLRPAPSENQGYGRGNYLTLGASLRSIQDLAYHTRLSRRKLSAGGTDIRSTRARFCLWRSTLHWGDVVPPKEEDSSFRQSARGAHCRRVNDLDRFYSGRDTRRSGDSHELAPRSKPYPSHLPLTPRTTGCGRHGRIGVATYMPIARADSATPSRHPHVKTRGLQVLPLWRTLPACNYLDDLRDGTTIPAGVSRRRVQSSRGGKRRASGAVYWDRKSGEMVTVEAVG